MILLVYSFVGAIIGMLVMGKRIGRYAMITGAICGILPEIDQLIGFLMPTLSALRFTNGFTHSLIIILVSSPGISLIIHKIYFSRSISIKRWVMMVFWAMSANVIIDLFTIKGVALFYPIISKSYSLGSLANTDYFLILPLMIGLILLVIFSYKQVLSMIISLFLLLFVGAYLAFTVVNKVNITSKFERVLFNHRMPFTNIDVFPCQGSNFNWNLIARNSDGYWESKTNTYSEDTLQVTFNERNEFFLIDFENHSEVEDFKKYTRYWYNVFPGSENEIFFIDIRYGKNEAGSYNQEFKFFVTDNQVLEIEKVDNN